MRGTRGGRLLQKGWGWLPKKGGGFLRTLCQCGGPAGVQPPPADPFFKRFSPHLPCETPKPPPIFGDFDGFSPDSRRLSIHFVRFSVIFNQFRSASISFNQLSSGSISLTRSKTHEFIDNRKVGKTTLHSLCLPETVGTVPYHCVSARWLHLLEQTLPTPGCSGASTARRRCCRNACQFQQECLSSVV